MARVHAHKEDLDRAMELYGESLRIERELGDHALEAGTLNQMGIISYSRGQKRDAASFWEESRLVTRQTGARASLPPTLSWLAPLYAEEGRWADALDAAREYAALVPDLQHPDATRGLSVTLSEIWFSAVDAGREDVADEVKRLIEQVRAHLPKNLLEVFETA
jgi:tetratricopeptide (TPR) repeat protein